MFSKLQHCNIHARCSAKMHWCNGAHNEEARYACVERMRVILLQWLCVYMQTAATQHHYDLSNVCWQGLCLGLDWVQQPSPWGARPEVGALANDLAAAAADISSTTSPAPAAASHVHCESWIQLPNIRCWSGSEMHAVIVMHMYLLRTTVTAVRYYNCVSGIKQESLQHVHQPGRQTQA
jgi:hypothetical protein